MSDEIDYMLEEDIPHFSKSDIISLTLLDILNNFDKKECSNLVYTTVKKSVTDNNDPHIELSSALTMRMSVPKAKKYLIISLKDFSINKEIVNIEAVLNNQNTSFIVENTLYIDNKEKIITDTYTYNNSMTLYNIMLDILNKRKDIEFNSKIRGYFN